MKKKNQNRINETLNDDIIAEITSEDQINIIYNDLTSEIVIIPGKDILKDKGKDSLTEEQFDRRRLIPLEELRKNDYMELHPITKELYRDKYWEIRSPLDSARDILFDQYVSYDEIEKSGLESENIFIEEVRADMKRMGSKIIKDKLIDLAKNLPSLDKETLENVQKLVELYNDNRASFDVRENLQSKITAEIGEDVCINRPFAQLTEQFGIDRIMSNIKSAFKS